MGADSRVNTMAANSGVGKVACRTTLDANHIAAELNESMKKSKTLEICSVFVGKGEIERAQQDQMSSAFAAAQKHLGTATKQERDAALMRTNYPDAEGRWSYVVMTAPRSDNIKEVLIAGRIKPEDFCCAIWVYDREIRAEFEKLDRASQWKQLFPTKMKQVHSQQQLTAMVQETMTERAAKGKGRGAGGKGKGGKASEPRGSS